MKRVLGLSAFFHDSAAALVLDGRVVAAAQEERFTRRKNDPAFPAHAVGYCLAEAGLRVEDLDAVVFYEKPLLRFERILEGFLRYAPGGLRQFLRAGPVWAGEKLFVERTLRRELGWAGDLLFTEHHEAHAASAFLPSPFAEAAILTVDGVGEWATTAIGWGRADDVEILEEIHYPHSVGLLYSAFTHYLGFRINNGEYKVMGLAPYGEPRYAERILEDLVEAHSDGSFALQPEYFGFLDGLEMTNARFDACFGGERRQPEGPLDQRHLDVAASIQKATEELMLGLARRARDRTGADHLVMAGGVALNCVANGRIRREVGFDDVWVQPAAGDAGGALGAALLAWHRAHHGATDTPTPAAAPGTRSPVEARNHGVDAMEHALLGPGYPWSRVEEGLRDAGVVWEEPADRTALLEEVVDELERGSVVGWFQGRMEFGPRALGARSILADPRAPGMQSRINQKIKFRESFRPFAPCVLEEHAAEWFELDGPSPYMLFTVPVHPTRRLDVDADASGLERLHRRRSEIPAVTHVDGSARVQTVGPGNHPLRALLSAFYARTGCPVLVNTSFNVRGEPIVCSPDDAIRCFFATDLDVLVLERALLLKGNQPTDHPQRRAPAPAEVD